MLLNGNLDMNPLTIAGEGFEKVGQVRPNVDLVTDDRGNVLEIALRHLRLLTGKIAGQLIFIELRDKVSPDAAQESQVAVGLDGNELGRGFLPLGTNLVTIGRGRF